MASASSAPDPARRGGTPSRFSGAKLFAGKTLAAWRAFPATRRALARIPAGPPILITGTHRSGTTWVAGMLAAPGVWYVHEPFNINKGLWPENFSYVPADEPNPRVDALVDALLRGRHRRALNLPWAEHWSMPLRWLPVPVRRVLLKDPMACLMSGYLTRRFGFRTLVLFRHPGAFVASIRRLGWPAAPVLRRFAACEPLMRDWLAPQEDLVRRGRERDDVFSYAVLGGALNRVLWGYVERSGGAMRPLRFEELCDDPLARFAELYRLLELPYGPETRAAHADLSLAEDPTRRSYRTHAVRRYSPAMADRWRTELSEGEASEVRAVWEAFGVPLYDRDPDW